MKTSSRHADAYDAAQPDPRKPARGPGQPPKDGTAATGHIHLRVTMARKNAYVRAARPGKLTEWIFERLDKAAGYGQQDERKDC